MDAYSSLARALDDVAGLDDAVEFEAAVLVDGRHDAHARARRLDAIEARLDGRLQLHAS